MFLILVTMNDTQIQKEYAQRANEDIQLLCANTTRRDGFMDVLLSKALLSSTQAMKCLGKVQAHRGKFGLNDYVSFSSGHVSYRYSNRDIENKESYVGGMGIFFPLKKIISYTDISFSHCSNRGNLSDEDLDRKNISQALHYARTHEELDVHDGYGNLFEIGVGFKQVTLPKLDLDKDAIIAIPSHEKQQLVVDLKKRHQDYVELYSSLKDKSFGDILGRSVPGRTFYYPDKTKSFLETISQPFDIEELPIYWYDHKNLDIALQYKSLL